MIRRIADTKVAIAIAAPGFRASKEGSLGASAGNDSNNFSIAPKRVIKAVILTRTKPGFGRERGFWSLGLSYSVKRQWDFDLHPDGNGFLITAEPFESEIYFYQSLEGGSKEERGNLDIDEFIEGLREEFDEKAENLVKMAKLGRLPEAAINNGRVRLGDEFKLRLGQALTSF